MLTSNQVKEQLTTEDIINLCCVLQGSDTYFYDSKNNPMFLTSLDHEGGDSYKEVYYSENKVFHCYTRGDTYDIFELVRRAKHFDTFIEAFNFVCSFFNLSDSEELAEKEPVLADLEIFQQIENFENITTYEENPPISENYLAFFCFSCVPYIWTLDNISVEAMVYFHIGIEAALEKIIIPHRNIRGELIGIRSRNLNQFDIANGLKYSPVQVEGVWLKHKLGLNLYGIYENLETIKTLKKVVIFEAEKSVLQVASYYGVHKNWSLATCGSNLSDEQMNLLISLGVEEVILAYDKEYQGVPGTEDYQKYLAKLYEHVQYLTQYVRVYIIMDRENLLQYKDSPSDRGKEIFEKLLHSKIYVPCVYSKSLKNSTKKGRK